MSLVKFLCFAVLMSFVCIFGPIIPPSHLLLKTKGGRGGWRSQNCFFKIILSRRRKTVDCIHLFTLPSHTEGGKLPHRIYYTYQPPLLCENALGWCPVGEQTPKLHSCSKYETHGSMLRLWRRQENAVRGNMFGHGKCFRQQKRTCLFKDVLKLDNVWETKTQHKTFIEASTASEVLLLLHV